MMAPKIYKKQLNNIVNVIIKNYNPEKVVLFGSRARGKIKNTSDIDLLIIKKTNEDYLNRVKKLALMCAPEVEIGVDFLVYTPFEIKNRLKMNDCFIKEIINQGKTLYES